MDNYSLSDIAAASGNEAGFGGNSAWVLIILFAMIFGGGGFFGNNNRVGESYATQADIQRSQDLNTLRDGQSNILNGVKDIAYNTLSDIKDIQTATATGFAEMQKCCSDTLRAIDGVNYAQALNTAAINDNTTAQTQKILDAISANRMADMQNQINQLQMQNMLAGVVRYPMLSTYSSGSNPFCANGCNCGTV